MGEILVREGRLEDAGLLASFNRRMARETEGRELERDRSEAGVRAAFARPERGTYFIADETGEPVGALFVTHEWSDWRNGDFWWIQSVFVVPGARGRGVFRALYDFVLARARAAGEVCGVRLYVERDNTRAQAVYSAVGMHSSHYRLYEVDFVLGSEEERSTEGST